MLLLSLELGGSYDLHGRLELIIGMFEVLASVSWRLKRAVLDGAVVSHHQCRCVGVWFLTAVAMDYLRACGLGRLLLQNRRQRVAGDVGVALAQSSRLPPTSPVPMPYHRLRLLLLGVRATNTYDLAHIWARARISYQATVWRRTGRHARSSHRPSLTPKKCQEPASACRGASTPQRVPCSQRPCQHAARWLHVVAHALASVPRQAHVFNPRVERRVGALRAACCASGAAKLLRAAERGRRGGQRACIRFVNPQCNSRRCLPGGSELASSGSCGKQAARCHFELAQHTRCWHTESSCQYVCPWAGCQCQETCTHNFFSPFALLLVSTCHPVDKGMVVSLCPACTLLALS